MEPQRAGAERQVGGDEQSVAIVPTTALPGSLALRHEGFPSICLRVEPPGSALALRFIPALQSESMFEAPLYSTPVATSAWLMSPCHMYTKHKATLAYWGSKPGMKGKRSGQSMTVSSVQELSRQRTSAAASSGMCRYKVLRAAMASAIRATGHIC